MKNEASITNPINPFKDYLNVGAGRCGTVGRLLIPFALAIAATALPAQLRAQCRQGV